MGRSFIMMSSFTPSHVYLEITKACDYSCLHCNTGSKTDYSSEEMSAEEIKSLLLQIKTMGSGQSEVIITGGNPLMRSDFKDIVNFANRIGVAYSINLAATTLLDEEKLQYLKESRVESISIALDGASSDTHDWLRNRQGSYDLTLSLIERMEEAEINVRVCSTVFKRNIMELPKLAFLLRSRGISDWEIYFLIENGINLEVEQVTPEEYMQINFWLFELKRLGISVRTFEGPLLEVSDKLKPASTDFLDGGLYEELTRETNRLFANPSHYIHRLQANAKRMANRPVKGSVFVGHDGRVYPSGLLPYKIGNARCDPLLDLLSRNARIIKPNTFGMVGGKCGRCVFSDTCGGSRARAFSATGDIYAEDPACLYPGSNPRTVFTAINTADPSRSDPDMPF